MLAEHYEFPIRNPGDPRVILYARIQHIVGQNLASHYHTQVVIAQPDLNLYEIWGNKAPATFFDTDYRV